MHNDTDVNGMTPDESPLAQLSEGRLIDSLQERAAVATPNEALTELIRRQSRRVPEISMDILADEGYQPELRATAAVELGRSARPTHRRALTEALGSDHPLVVRRAAEAIGRIGDAEAADALSRVHPRHEEVKRSVAFARALIAYRVGLEASSFTAPGEEKLLEVRSDEAIELQPTAVAGDELDKISSNLRRILPAIPVTEKGAREFSCGKTLTGLRRRKLVPAVVLKRSQVLGTYYVYQYLFTDPDPDGGLRVFGVRPSGVMTHYGEADIDRDQVGVWIRTVDTPHSPPVNIRLTYDHTTKGLDFETAVINPQPVGKQRRARQPRKLRTGGTERDFDKPQMASFPDRGA